jgi:hypothetical protein
MAVSATAQAGPNFFQHKSTGSFRQIGPFHSIRADRAWPQAERVKDRVAVCARETEASTVAANAHRSPERNPLDCRRGVETANLTALAARRRQHRRSRQKKPYAMKPRSGSVGRSSA